MEDGSNKVNYNEYLAKESKKKIINTDKPKEVYLRGWD
jgi:hypothetical protein